MNPGTPFSLLLVAGGAILAWGVDDRVEGINLATVGIILMAVGILGLMFSLAFWGTVFGSTTHRRDTIVEAPPTTVYREEPTVVVDRRPREVVRERERVVTRDEADYNPRI